MKQLTIKELAPYLPYGLKVNIGNYQEKNIELTPQILISYVTESIKPILRPLSDLTKEIEHNGERVVPIEILYGNNNATQRDLTIFYYELQNHSAIGFICAYYGHVQKLFEWHFDVFRLIDEGLAIDINTL